METIATIVSLVAIAYSVVITIVMSKKINKLKDSDKELAKTMIMNFNDYDKELKEQKETHAEIKRDNQAIMNELKHMQSAVRIMNTGFSVPSFQNIE